MPTIDNESRTPDPIDLFAGVQLRKLRTERGISQTDLATTIGVTFQQVQKYERGDNRISASRLWKLAAALQAPISAFFPEDGQVPALPPVDPITNRAKELYEAGRRRVSGRPRWADLNPDDPYDMGMKQVAIDEARRQLEDA